VTRSVTRVNGHARDFGAFDRLVDDAFDRFFGGSRAGTPAEARAPAIDVVETESQYTVTVDLPGVAREDVKVSIDGKRVSIEAQAGTSAEKKDGLNKALEGADPELVNFLELLIEKNRMTEIFRIRRQFEQLWKQENKRIDVTVTSAVELDPAVVEKIGEEIERQTGRKVELASRVDGEILGGIVLQVGNMVLDASIRSRLEKLRKSVAQAA